MKTLSLTQLKTSKNSKLDTKLQDRSGEEVKGM